MLQLEHIRVTYGPIQALNDVSLQVSEGQFVAVVGPNGAGKTTLFRSISGQMPVASGRILYDGQDLLAMPARQRAHLGIAHVPEGRQVFASLTVYENLDMGACTKRGRAEWKRNLDLCYSLFPVLEKRCDQLAGTLSGGEQQMLAIARGLASSPRLLMLDEPSMGLAPIIADNIFESIQTLHKERGLTILLVEQRVAEALEPCDHAYVLEAGRCVAEGPPAEVVRNERIQQAYLGHIAEPHQRGD